MKAPVVLGVVHGLARHHLDPMDIEVRLPIDMEGVELGPLTLPTQQAWKLWKLLGVALTVLEGETPWTIREIAAEDLGHVPLPHGVMVTGEEG